jgi:curli production assembly/transport component CsgG
MNPLYSKLLTHWGKRLLLLSLSIVLLSSCVVLDPSRTIDNLKITKLPEVAQVINTELWKLKEPKTKPVVAVYGNSFTDQTGQRRSNSSYASFSTAVTQAPYTLLIQALKNTGQGKFFEVVERVGLDNLSKERQLIRSTRETFKEPQKLKPLMFAGLLMEGAVVSYESNIRTGGLGGRILGIGLSRQYRQDTVTISLRTVSVLTGRILTEVTVTKTILSVGLNQDIFRFITDNTELIEIENGNVENESITIALQSSIETALLKTIKQGIMMGYWSYKNEK